MMRFSFFSLSLLLATACAAGAGTRPDGGGGGGTDAQTSDTGNADAPVGEDAPMNEDAMVTPDAPMGVDTGPDEDAGPPDDTGPGEDSGPVDGGPDSGPMEMDAGTDSGPAPDCVRDEDCDDDNACTGIERCVGDTCMPGTPVTCDDAVSCTVDECNPATGTCSFTPEDSMCVAPLTCDGTRGCIDPSCAEMPCRLVSPQCGCPAGQGCYVGGTMRTCAPAGTSVEGASCTGDICAPGNICVNVNGDPGGDTPMCKRWCGDHGDCVGTGSRCLLTLTGTDEQICTRHCNPRTAAGCPSGTYCNLFQEMSGRLFTDCEAPPGAGGQNASCTDTSDCQVGFTCLGTAPDAECLRWCIMPGTVDGGCGAGFACYGFMTPLVFDGQEYGVCDRFPPP